MSKANKFSSVLRFLSIAGLAAGMMLAVSCSSLRVRTDYAHTFNFDRVHTYSWLRVNAGNSLWSNRVRRDVDAQLQNAGWVEVPNGGQLDVAAFRATRQVPTLQTFYSSFGPGFGGWGWWGFYGGGFNSGYATTNVTYTPYGTLVVDMFNPANHQLVWRSVAKEKLTGTVEQDKSKLQNAVAKMFNNFPPPPLG